ncbi:hypothetical protein CI238_08929 [Colletotrichum incanum]|uniref:Uncharacterized protein n=1 Tax=Colletotrichum incanum TaxID=1573173 RepID=A0A167A277_COLIC|nr:hypothetical protein CI238_08929 [Colletotrichum incanum]OHW92299.1 hypothetical protein CSPAE12_09022 [Colletotrichum incanum]
MCFTNVKYSCDHKEKRVLKCRRLWSARTGWCCYPVFLFVFGWPTEEPCSDFFKEKAILSSTICPACTEAEQSGPHTRGIVPSKYRHKLTSEALNASRKRMQEEKENEEVVKERWYSREENFRETLRKREQEERLEREAAADGNAKTDKALPNMPSFVHVPLGDRWGDPSYHYPQHIANAYGVAPNPLPKEPIHSGLSEQQTQPPHVPERLVKNIDVVLMDRDRPAISLERSHPDRQRSDRHQHGREHVASAVDSHRYAQHLVGPADIMDRRQYASQHDTSLNSGPYRHLPTEPVDGGQARHNLRTQEQKPQQPLHRQSRYAEPRSLTNTRLVPQAPIVERRGHEQPQPLTDERPRPREPRRRGTEPMSSAKTPRSGSLKGFFQAFGNSSRRSEDYRRDRDESPNVTSDVHSDISSFVCRKSRDVEKGRRM